MRFDQKADGNLGIPFLVRYDQSGVAHLYSILAIFLERGYLPNTICS